MAQVSSYAVLLTYCARRKKNGQKTKKAGPKGHSSFLQSLNFVLPRTLGDNGISATTSATLASYDFLVRQYHIQFNNFVTAYNDERRDLEIPARNHIDD